MNEVPKEALREYLLAFADDEHLMGQQHTEWIGVAPFLEEDLAFSSIGQDELGHSVLLYELVSELDGTDPSSDAVIDALAYDRDAAEYRSSALTEYATTDWAEALVRHWIYDIAEEMRWSLVADSTHAPLAAVAERVGREESYHRMHANALLDALLSSAKAKEKLLQALATISPLAAGLLGPTAGEEQLIAAGVIGESPSGLSDQLSKAIGNRFGTTGPSNSPSEYPRNSDRSESFSPLMARMREVIEYDPGATW